ncbi:SDR family NAD(P)-dependent oxidoreductase [Nitrospirillum amazonense]|uniref:3-oxoacyl-[acyl-carrier protein] reductase n=1 Tax=Nitrospirillum amazonense TaxID=28077 RepID=A0A560KI47_9PROT|nr:SDR family oxidoreductase [Nitrospirillum amazonense]MDG3442961.1 SDR family oxidoreductase [Nitrospirillum amazonense]TWB82897.1 3-oxoacyl-[acyl-carrier protein] reductase [Nitrospirillum amazonense]
MSDHIIVTGGSRGLGLALVRALLADGWRVSTCARGPTAEVEDLTARHGDRFLFQVAQVGDADQVTAFVDAATAWAGGLYGLVNNAGIAREGILATLPQVEIDTLIQTNLNGAIQAARAALRHLLRRPATAAPAGGRIINISSIIGQRGYTGLAAYAATKAGMDGMTRALAREVGRRGITVNSVAPGYLETEMSSTLSAGQRDQIIRRTPLGRLGTADDVVPVVRFLLGPSAAYITGQTLVVDGGISC